MTATEHTAYPRFKRNLTAKDLAEVYTPTPAERFLAARSTKRCIYCLSGLYGCLKKE